MLFEFKMLLCCMINVSSDKRIGELVLELLKQTCLKDAILGRNAMLPYINNIHKFANYQFVVVYLCICNHCILVYSSIHNSLPVDFF